MSAYRHYYYWSHKNFNKSAEVDSMFFTESSSSNQINLGATTVTEGNHITNEEEKDYDDSELIPYTPNSVDRSSVGSIPWADDAIKQNQLDWERIEHLLAGKEQTIPEEIELTQEIWEWQQKFPQLVNGQIAKSEIFQIQQSFDSTRTNLDDSLDIDTLSNLTLEFSDNDLDDGFATPTTNYKETHKKKSISPRHRKNSMADLAQQLSHNLRISSVPLTWRQRQNHARDITRPANFQEHSALSAASALSPPPRPPPRRHSPIFNSLIIAPTQPKLRALPSHFDNPRANIRVPSLLNVIESKKRFRGLTNNRSFVQLTQLQHTKSAAMTQQHETRAGRRNQQTSWHMPLAAAAIGNRFLNNRSSIVLPAINLRRINEHRATDATSSASSGTSLPATGAISLQDYTQYTQEPTYLLQQYVMPSRKHFVNSSTTPSTSGRSISAAVHHPRVDLSAFYLPYSAATKFKSFNKI